MKSKLAKISATTVATIATFAGSMSATFAATSPMTWISSLTGTSGTLDSWIITVLNWAIGLAALAAVVMLIAAGFMYITANGDENKIGKATKTLTFAIVGLVICFIAVMLVNFVLNQWLQN